MAEADPISDAPGAALSPRLFVFAAAGVCFGLSDIWRFPYLLVAHESMWFPLLYLVGVVMIGMPLLVAELALSRLGHSHPSLSYGFDPKEAEGNGLWSYAGIIVLIAAFLILSYSTVVAAWMMGYAVRAGLGALDDVSVGAARLMFHSLVTDPERLLGWHTLFMLGLGWMVAKGTVAGVGRFSQAMVLTVLVIAVVLAGWSLYHDTQWLRELSWSLHWSALSGGLIVDALTQSFFTLGVCMGAVMILGVCLEPGARTAPLVMSVLALDTLFVLLASIIAMPVLVGVETATEGMALAMETIPLAFSEGGYGRLRIAAFYVLLFLLVCTTALVLMELLVSWIQEKTGKIRTASTSIAAITVWFGGLLALLSFSVFSFEFEFVGTQRNFGLFDVMDILSSQILLPLIGLMMAVFIGWNADKGNFGDQLEWKGAAPLMYNLNRYFLPIVLVAIFVALVFGRVH